jgi:GMP synthase-like glutamine amidotransferase
MKPLLVFQHVGCETPDTFLDLLPAQKRPMETVRFYEGDRALDDLSPFAGLLVTGGPMSVNDELLSLLSRDKYQKSSGLFISLRVLLRCKWS